MFIIYYLINWCLKKNNETVIELKNISSKISRDILEFIEDNATNTIDIKNKIYKRTTNDFTMIIDFNKKTCEFIFNDIDTCKIDINCSINIKNNLINLEYFIDEDKMNINIEIRNDLNERKD